MVDPKVLTDAEVNVILERWDKTDPAIQRRTIVTLIALRMNILEAINLLMDSATPNECLFVDNVRKAYALTKGL